MHGQHRSPTSDRPFLYGLPPSTRSQAAISLSSRPTAFNGFALFQQVCFETAPSFVLLFITDDSLA